MGNKFFIIINLLFFFITSSYAQQTWTLQDCINRAIVNSIQIKRYNCAVKISTHELSISKNSRLPVLSGSAVQDFFFGRGLSQENTYTSTDVKTSSFSITGEFPIYTGLRISNTVKQKQHLYKASLLDLQKAEDALRIDVIRAYHDILYKQEQVSISYKRYEIDSLQAERVKTMYERGRLSKIDYIRQMAAKSHSKTKYIQDINARELSILNLAQLMELPSSEGLKISAYDIDVDQIHLEEPDEIYKNAIAYKPEIQAEEQRVKASEREIKVVRSYYYPTLSLSGGICSKYYNISNVPNESFGIQFKNNLSEYVSFNLTIPIFNRFERRNNIRKSKVQLEDQILVLEEKKKELFKAIQKAYFAAMDAKSSFAAYKEAKANAEESLKLIIAKYERGLADISEYNEEMRAYSEVESNLVQAKYEFIFAMEVIKFYEGI